jgi:hypothetical protein
MKMRPFVALTICMIFVAVRSACASPQFTVPASGNQFQPNVFLAAGSYSISPQPTGTNPLGGSASGSFGNTGATGSVSYSEQWTQLSPESMEFTESATGTITGNLSSYSYEIVENVGFQGFEFVLDSPTDVYITGSLSQDLENAKMGSGGGAYAESVYISGPGANLPYQEFLSNSTPGPSSLSLGSTLDLGPGTYSMLIYEQNNWAPLSSATVPGTFGGSGGFDVTVDLPEPSPIFLLAVCGLLAAPRNLRLLRSRRRLAIA